MALSGTIADWSFADILQVISAQQKSGILRLACGNEQVSMTFSDGKIAAVERQETARQSGFLRFLVDTGRLAPAGARRVAALMQEGGDDAMETLRQAELLDLERLAPARQAFAQEVIFRVLQWDEGDYAFTARAVAVPAGLPPIATEGLLFEGMRRIDEWSRISERVTPETVFRALPGQRLDAELPRRERALLRLLDGIQDVRALERMAPLTRYEVGESLLALVQAGLIEACTGEAQSAVIELEIGDLEPVPRFERLLHRASLLVLVAASLLFGAVTQGSDWSRRGGSGAQPRQRQALRFSLELYRAERGAYPAAIEQLAELGLETPGTGARLVYRPDPGGQDYTLIEAPQPATTGGISGRVARLWRR